MARSVITHAHVQRMLSQIQENYTHRLTLGTLATTLGRQSAYLGRLFRDEVGVTVHEYVTRARIAEGAVQVRSGVKIEAVALSLGYRSKKNFYRQFKRRLGCTPTEYRRQRLGGIAGDVAGESWADPQTVEPAAQRPNPVGTAGSTLDQIRERASELATLPKPAMLQTFVGSRVAILAIDDASHCVGANRAVISMTGYSAGELRGMSLEALFFTKPTTSDTCVLVVPSTSLLPTNAVLRTKAADAIDVHVTSAADLLWDLTSILNSSV
jgi:AraC-like DNA-binding protein